MVKDIMLKIITNNFWAKVICLLFATGVWIYVAQGETKIANFPGGVNLSYRNAPQGLVVINDTDKVQIKISAERNSWKTLSAENFSAYLDLSGLTQGTHEAPVKINTSVSGVQVVEINPDKVLVRLEPVSTKKISVTVKVEGQAGEGLVPGDAKTDPEEVEVSGAKSVVDRLFEATAVIKLNQETSDINKSVAVAALDAQGETVRNLTFNPQEIKVTVPIVKAASSKTVGLKINISGKPKSGYWISQIVTTPQEITITGSSSVLKPISYISTNDVNVDGLDKDKTYQVAIDLPNGATLIDNIDKIKVEVKLSSVDSQKEVTASLNWLNLATNLKVSAFSPNTVKVLLTGPQSLLDISGANVVFNINLFSYKTAGAYNLDLSRDALSAPDGLAVSSFVPSSLSVVLENK